MDVDFCLLEYAYCNKLFMLLIFKMIILSAAALAEELPNVNLKELPNINLKDLPRDLPRDLPKDLPKDLPNFSAKETWTSTPILEQENPAEGYYAFVQSNAEPPKIKPPPYVDSDKECYGSLLFKS